MDKIILLPDLPTSDHGSKTLRNMDTKRLASYLKNYLEWILEEKPAVLHEKIERITESLENITFVRTLHGFQVSIVDTLNLVNYTIFIPKSFKLGRD